MITPTVLIILAIIASANGKWSSSSSSKKSKSDDTLIETTEGYVQGIERDGILQFIGIPYAKPPIDELRFEPPQELEERPKNDILNATQILDSVPLCPQVFGGSIISTDEDCLYLNIFVTSNDNMKKNKKKKLPVMLWIHGGYFDLDGGSTEFYDPTNWLNNPNANDVIIVTVNYRIGALGFLYDNTGLGTGIVGNYGYLDVIQATKWVHQNIKAFGGDGKNIITFGQSAGSYLAILQLLYHPQYVKGSILQSPAFNVPLRDPVTWYNTFETFVGSVGCLNPLTISQCLRNKSVEDILTAQSATVTGVGTSIYALPYPGNEWTWLPLIWSPTALTEIIPNQVLFEFQDNEVETVPFIIGTVRDEQFFTFSQAFIGIDYQTFVRLLAYRVDGMNIFDPTASVIPSTAPNTFSILLHYGLSSQNSQQNISLTGDFQNDLLEISSDYWYCSTRNVLKNLNDTKKFYYYNFDYINPQTNFIHDSVYGSDGGCINRVCHGVDLFYEFQAPSFQFQFDDESIEMGDIIQQLFTDYAEDLKISKEIWPQYTNDEDGGDNFLRILSPNNLLKQSTFSSESRAGTNSISAANNLCEFWDGLGYLYGSERSLDDHDDDSDSVSPAYNNDENREIKVYEPVDGTSHDDDNNNDKLNYILFGSIGVCIFGLMMVICIVICCYKKQRKKQLNEIEKNIENNDIENIDEDSQ